MAVHCSACNSTDVQAGFNTWQCLNCGKHTRMEDVPQPGPGLEAATAAAAEKK